MHVALVGILIFIFILVQVLIFVGKKQLCLKALEGNKGQPRLKPPFPALVGLYGCPTIVNNVETIAVVPTLLRKGSKMVFFSWKTKKYWNKNILYIWQR